MEIGERGRIDGQRTWTEDDCAKWDAARAILTLARGERKAG